MRKIQFTILLPKDRIHGNDNINVYANKKKKKKRKTSKIIVEMIDIITELTVSDYKSCK